MIEIQYQPANIRRQVAYYFLRPLHAALLGVVVVGILAVIVYASTVVPIASRSLLLAYRSRALAQDLAVEQEKLLASMKRVDDLERRLETDDEARTKLSLVLGAPQLESYAGGRAATAADSELAEFTMLNRVAELAVQSQQLLRDADSLERFLGQHDNLLRIAPSVCPLPDGMFALSSPYGQRISPFTGNPDFHPGIDLAARTGTPVVAAADGTVVFAGRVRVEQDVRWWRLGNVVLIAHGGRFFTLYAHLHEVTTVTGRQVRRGERIGAVGNTGWSTSAHLHYEVQRVDPGITYPVPLDPRIFILDHEWQEHEALLVARRSAPPPTYEPLPSLASMR
jgi:murein DD-endopeptidase MepM/ murein hydrolase activator NlpD